MFTPKVLQGCLVTFYYKIYFLYISTQIFNSSHITNSFSILSFNFIEVGTKISIWWPKNFLQSINMVKLQHIFLCVLCKVQHIISIYQHVFVISITVLYYLPLYPKIKVRVSRPVNHVMKCLYKLGYPISPQLLHSINSSCNQENIYFITPKL